MIRKQTGALVVFTVLTATGLGACKGRGAAASDTMASRADSASGRVDSTSRAAAATRTDSMRADSMHRNDSTNVAARNGWTEPSIVGYTIAANNGEIELGQLGEKKATNPKVKAFAREMVTDHRAMLAESKSLSSKLASKADTTANNVTDLANHARDELKDLTDKAAGADWDKDFINKMIDDHQHVLDKLQDAAKSTTNADVRSALEKATGKVQQHLTKAQDIKTNVLKD
jgi:putative membrane protein